MVAVSGEVDLLTDGEQVLHGANGDALLTKVTGGGCALGAVMAAFLGASRSLDLPALAAIVSANAVYTVAAERAAAVASGPGSFAAALLDALAALQPADVREGARVWSSAR